MHLSIITNQIIILSFLAVIGVIATATKVINEGVKNSIARIVFNITLPFLILTSVTNIDLNKEILSNIVWVFAFSFLALFLLLFAGMTTRRILGIKGATGNIHVLHTTFGNVAFLGYPLFSALFPNGEGLLYAVIYHFAQDVIIWTFGVFIFNSAKNLSIRQNLLHLLNPNTVSFVLATLMLAFSLKLPEFIYKPLYNLGHTTIYLAMLYIGAVLAQNPMLKAFMKGKVFVLGFNKLLFIPFIVLLIIEGLKHFAGLNMGETAETVVVMQAAMPCMAMVVVLAKKFNSDDLHATENLFVTTLLSLATLPVVYTAIQFFFN